MDSSYQPEPKPIEEYRAVLMLLARRQLGRRWRRYIDDADIVQTALLEAHRDEASYRGSSDEERFAWLRRILTRTILDAVRRLTRDKRNVKREIDWELAIRDSSVRIEHALVDPQSSPVQKAERREQLQRLARALQALCPAQREAIELFHIDCYPLPEVATILNRSTTAVSGLIFRGLAKLRHHLRADNQE